MTKFTKSQAKILASLAQGDVIFACVWKLHDDGGLMFCLSGAQLYWAAETLTDHYKLVKFSEISREARGTCLKRHFSQELYPDAPIVTITYKVELL